MNIPIICVDFNEMVEPDLVLLSQIDSKIDSLGNDIFLYNGLELFLYMEDFDTRGFNDNLIAKGIVEENHIKDWSSHVKWCCRLSKDGIRHQSEIKN